MIVGGAQENTLYTLRSHVEHGLDAVLVAGPGGGPEGNLLATNNVPGLPVVEIPHLVRDLDPWADIAAYRELRRYFASESFDVVHTHSSKAGILGRIAARRAGVPVVVHTIHGPPFHAYERWWRNQMYIAAEKVAARYCDRIFSVADAMNQQFIDAGIAEPERYQTVYSGMELDAFLNATPDPALRERLGIPADAKVIGKIARLFELKGYEYLLAAAPAIVERVPDAHFLIVGDGDLRSAIEHQVGEAGLTDRFSFAGLVPPAEVPAHVALMDVLVHLSLREGLPRTVVQALAAGKPAIGFALDGTPEAILDGRTGCLCAARDAAAVAEAAARLLTCPDEAAAMGAAGREHVRERWDWHHMGDVLETAYRELLAETPG
jgi:glycosyltransferase involved in cell wall biosynthesis